MCSLPFLRVSGASPPLLQPMLRRRSRSVESQRLCSRSLSIAHGLACLHLAGPPRLLRREQSVLTTVSIAVTSRHPTPSSFFLSSSLILLPTPRGCCHNPIGQGRVERGRGKISVERVEMVGKRSEVGVRCLLGRHRCQRAMWLGKVGSWRLCGRGRESVGRKRMEGSGCELWSVNRVRFLVYILAYKTNNNICFILFFRFYNWVVWYLDQKDKNPNVS